MENASYGGRQDRKMKETIHLNFQPIIKSF